MPVPQPARQRGQRAGGPANEDEALLKFGIQQETRRELYQGHNAGVAISIITAPAVITGSMALAWGNGGPISVTWGWTIAALLAMLIGLCMAEISSGLPSAGGPFFWASWLAGEHGPIFSWVTGWANMTGQFAITAGIAATFMGIATTMVLQAAGRQLSVTEQLAIYGGVLVASGLLSSLPSSTLARLSAISLMWHIVTILSTTLLVPMIAPYHQGPAFVWTKFYGVQYSSSGITSNLYLFMQGLLFGNWCFTGYDSCAHMSEETAGAGASVPRALVWAVGSSAVLGYLNVVALMFSVQDPSTLMTGSAGGNVAAQIYVDAFVARFNSGTGGVLIIGANLLACFFATQCSVAANSRMFWAFAREGAIPGHRYFRVINQSTRTPRRTVWLAVVVAFLLGLPLLKSAAAFNSVISVASVALTVSYGIPIACRVTLSRNTFKKGQFHLGRFSQVACWAAVLGICFNTIIFSLPPAFPITLANLNFAPIEFGGILLLLLLAWWCPVWGARLWYKGPRHSYEIRLQQQQQQDLFQQQQQAAS